MKHIYLVRHGQTDANKNKIWIGARSTYKLNDKGREEAMYAGSNLRDMSLNANTIYCSPVERAYQTGKIIQEKLSLPITPIPDLSEMFFGDIEGLDEDQFKNDFPIIYQQWLQTSLDVFPPNGESGRRFFRRVYKIVEELTLEADTTDLILVTHSGIIKGFVAMILNVDYLHTGYRNLNVPEIETGSITEFTFSNSVFRYIRTVGTGIDG